MKTFVYAVAILLALAASAGLGVWYGRQNPQKEAATTQPDDEDAKPVAQVTTAPAKMDDIADTFTAYGSVMAQLSDARVISVPFESHIGKIFVTPGEQVAADAELLVIEGSPDTLIALQDAKNSFDAATKDFTQTQQRFSDHLATNQELSAAQQTVNSAKLKLDSLVNRGVGTSQHLKANVAGVVAKVDVQEGQIVPAGGPLVEIAAGNQIEVKLGVEPNDAVNLKTGDAVSLHRVGASDSEKIEGKIRLIGQRVDPTTRLVDVLVSLPADSKLMLETYVVGELTKSQVHGLIVPRTAVLPDDDDQVLFTIKDDHAVKHVVKIGIENDEQVQIISDDVKEGDPVVIVGNHELEDGMEVKQ